MTLKSTLVTAICLLPLLCGMATVPAGAGDFGIRGGVYLDDTDPFVGIEWLGDFRGLWDVNPNFEVIFPDNVDRYSLNLDFHRDFPGADAAVWLGAGGGLIFTDPDNRFADDETDAAINLLAGIGTRTGAVRPYGQLKVVLSDESEAVVMGGLRF